ncbi:MAG TPA: DUF1697 domain-containing protein [Acidimicrobiia bacterium]|jgi:uncharacterized protein (DUF1697 family)|nr:DUF1697 domain-containing protein [Acidimicrobiia bacterium]
MATYVALLRGVNVGGRAQVSMRDLRDAVGALGYDDVSTYIQSGNVIFRNASRSAARIRAELERAIDEEFGLSVSVILRTPTELDRVVRRNPFLSRRADVAQLHVALLGKRPSRPALARLEPKRSPPDEFVAIDREIYLRCPNGIGRSKLTNDYFERQLDTPVTMRNWRTVTELLRLAQARP